MTCTQIDFDIFVGMSSIYDHIPEENPVIGLNPLKTRSESKFGTILILECLGRHNADR
jgi:hypothetical protein